jgi:3-carboxy-cis,cis-muconate cycloisomerase
MPASVADSAIYHKLFSDVDTARLFTDSAELRAMLLVEGALAKVQGELGVIPADSAFLINRSSLEVQIDPSALAAETAVNGVPVPALVALFRAEMNAPEHAQFVHWGATSQDIMDTALALRLRRMLENWDARLGSITSTLAGLAVAHAHLPMAARTYGQIATPTSFGAVVAGWGMPLLRHRTRLTELRAGLCVSLGGAAGTLAAMGGEGAAVRAELAKALGLTNPQEPWHSTRDMIGALASAMAGLAVSLAKFGEDLIAATQSGLAEIALGVGGGSSTMPQKQNPVGPSVLVALGRHCVGLAAMIQGAGIHRQQRDAAAWFVEWLTVSQLCISTGAALARADDLATLIAPLPDRMLTNLGQDNGVIFAEAFSFALASQMSRPEAQAKVKALCAEAKATNTPLLKVLSAAFPSVDWEAMTRSDTALGDAPAQATRFAALAKG